jgi:hypothetical protein
LNKVNNRTIRGAFGDDTAAWSGKIIAIFPTMVDFRGTMKPALRVRAAVAAKPAETAPPAKSPPADPELEPDPAQSSAQEMDDEIPF